MQHWSKCLSTIHFYIILKRYDFTTDARIRLSTIHFYIILKLAYVLDLYENSLSTIHFYIILKRRSVGKRIVRV